MPEIQVGVSLGNLIAIIGVLIAFNIGVISFIAKKYISRSDRDHERINTIETEHCIFHKEETGINGK